ncbi:biliverdin-producing heme oxygenase [Mucilaginibacter auburnensis]|uniref:Heme oxygenase n=1 Tax=Mucilaginibacter auburnensis TaxID=1457233 RepID=A0A2H9VMV8_9SPHI|nr:biliverdin-producing heme oxygenase [Mucilaginibacter auburnensis]PJJ79669.1 heme oxygenase [Mucilaginibacter auburnensis]
MLTEKIKATTLQYHQETEKILVGKMKSMRSVADYAHILELFYGYFGGLELLIDKHINTQNLPDYTDRRKTAALANDLTNLKGNLPPKAEDTELPQINNLLQAFGALYVIEGSTLGGKIISKMVQQHLGITDGQGLSFFNGYGEDTGNKWVQFQQKLNAIAPTEAQQTEVIAAANNTFEKFRDWMVKFSD